MGKWLKAMLIPSAIWCSQTIYLLETHALLLVLCVFFCTTLPRRLHQGLEKHPVLAQRVSLVAVPALLIVSMIFLVAETYNPFLYFRF